MPVSFRERIKEAREAREEFKAEVQRGLRDEWGRKTGKWEEREESRRERHRRHERERREGKRAPREGGGAGKGDEAHPAGNGDEDGKEHHKRRRRRKHHRSSLPHDGGVEILDPGNGPLGRELPPEEQEPVRRARGGSQARPPPPPAKIEMRPWLKKLLGKQPAQQGSSRAVGEARSRGGRGSDSLPRRGKGDPPGHPYIDDDEEAPADIEPVPMPEDPAAHQATVTDEEPAAAPVPMPDEADFVPAPTDHAEGHGHLDMHTDSEHDSVDDGDSEDGSNASTKATTAPPNEPLTGEAASDKATSGKQKPSVRGGGGDWDAEEYCLREEYDDDYEYVGRRPWNSSPQAPLARGQSRDPYNYRYMHLPPMQAVRMVPEIRVDDPDSRFNRYSQAYVPLQAGRYSQQGTFDETIYHSSRYHGNGRASDSSPHSGAGYGRYYAHESGATFNSISYSRRPKRSKQSSPDHARIRRRQDDEQRRRTSRTKYEDESDPVDKSDEPEESETESESDPDSGSESSEKSRGKRRQPQRSSGKGRHWKAEAIPSRPADFYAILDISPDSSEKEIKSAAKQMRIKVHPDRMNLAEKTEEEKQQIHEEATKVGQAGDVLSDPRRRREYHREVEDWEEWYGSR